MDRRLRSRLLSRVVAVLRVALVLVLALSLTGCLGLDLIELLKPTKKRKKRSSDDDGGVVDLGSAVYPEGTKKPTASHSWESTRLEEEFELEYVLAADQQKRILDAHQGFARRVNYTPLGGGRFRWVIPPGCEPDMGCAFGVMSDASREALEPLAALFKKRSKKAKLNTEELASLIVTFVQDIKYERPQDQPFEILPPASVVAEKRGDCDSKSLLAHLLLREFGIDSVMLSSRAHGHAMLGVAVPAPGKRFKFGGREYAFTELTAANSPIGHINPELLRPDDWKVVPTRWPSGGGGEAREGGR